MINHLDGSQVLHLDAFRTGRAYTVAQAAHLARTTPATVRRWLVGYEAHGHRMEPVFGAGVAADNDGPLTVSFFQLIEIAVAARFRALPPSSQVSLDRLRRAHRYAREHLGQPYPFATLDLFAFGGHVLHEFELEQPGKGVLALDTGSQWALPELVQQEEKRIDFATEDQLAIRWFPYGRQARVVVDPYVAAGRPTIYGRGITLETVARRRNSGETIEQLAEDYELAPEDLEQALRYAA